MAVAFGSVALLAAAQRDWLARERAISRTDGLTGLLNGRGFYEAAAVELARSTRYRHPLTLAYVDLDDFKSINDRFGHARGDAVLVAVARAMRRACRSTDLVGRVGGDEFVVLFPETGRDAAETALVKLRSRVEEAASQHGSRVTASIGSVSFAEAARRRRGAGARGRHGDVRGQGGRQERPALRRGGIGSGLRAVARTLRREPVAELDEEDVVGRRPARARPSSS